MSARDPHADRARLEDELAAYALGALEPAEAATLERHLAGCESCRERLGWLRPAVDLLPASVEQLAPPPRLRESLLEVVRREADAEAPPRAAAPRREPWWRRLRLAPLRPATALAALAVVLVVGATAGYLARGGDEPASSFVAAEGLGPAAPRVSATLERHGGSATLHVSEMPRLAANQVYEIWVQRAGTMEPRGTFVLGPGGAATAGIPGPLEGAEAVFVTREPRPGGPQPTSEPLLEAPLN